MYGDAVKNLASPIVKAANSLAEDWQESRDTRLNALYLARKEIEALERQLERELVAYETSFNDVVNRGH